MNDRNIGYDAAEPPEGKSMLYCDDCGAPLFDGESYYSICGKVICEGCITDYIEIA